MASLNTGAQEPVMVTVGWECTTATGYVLGTGSISYLRFDQQFHPQATKDSFYYRFNQNEPVPSLKKQNQNLYPLEEALDAVCDGQHVINESHVVC